MNESAPKPKNESIDSYIEHIQEELESIELVTNEDGKLLVREAGPISDIQNPYYWQWVRTPSFKKWFGDWEQDPEQASKIVSLTGEPLLVVHGSNRTFKPRSYPPLRALASTRGYATYFTPNITHALKHGDQLWFCFLDIRELVPNVPQDTMWHPDPKAVDKMHRDSKRLNLKALLLPHLKIGRGDSGGSDVGAERWIAFSVRHPKQIMDVPSPLLDGEKMDALRRYANKEISFEELRKESPTLHGVYSNKILASLDEE